MNLLPTISTMVMALLLTMLLMVIIAMLLPMMVLPMMMMMVMMMMISMTVMMIYLENGYGFLEEALCSQRPHKDSQKVPQGF